MVTRRPSMIVGDRHLAGQARIFVAVVRTVEQVVPRPRSASGQLVGMKRRIDVDMAGRAATAAAAQRQQLVKAVVADDFHQRAAFIGLAPRWRVPPPDWFDNNK
jgi:hypothetical protein